MLKTKIFMGLGSLVLASAAFVAGKPSKKFGTFTTGYAAGITGGGIAVVASGSRIFTTVNTGSAFPTAFFATGVSSSPNVYTLKTQTGGSGDKLFLK